MKKYLFPIIIAAFIIFIIPSSCTTLGIDTCAQKSKQYISELQSLIIEWDDANKIASSTSRIALSGPVSELQSIKHQISNLDHPECAADVHNTAITYMEATINGYLSFMADENENTTKSYFNLANDNLDEFSQALQKLNSTP
jgi:hypothetical protein